MLSGLVNAHTHIYSGLVPFGMPRPEPEPRNFSEILQRVWWRLDRALDEASLRASARYYAAEALLAGTTVLIDHHESPSFIEGSLDVIADTCEELGMRAVLCYGATERNGGRDEAVRGLEECRRFIRGNRRPLVRGVVGLHASFTVSDDTIRDAGRLCADLGVVTHVHLAEDRADLDDAERRGYAGPLERLLGFGALPPGSILAHGVHLTTEQVRRVQEAGCWIVQNPRSNRGNGVGYPMGLRGAGRVALGTDGFPGDMLSERDVLLDVGAAAGESLPTLDARCVGSLRLASDLFETRIDLPGEGIDISNWLSTRARTARESLIVNGRAVCQSGRLMTADRDEIHATAERESQRLWERLDKVKG